MVERNPSDPHFFLLLIPSRNPVELSVQIHQYHNPNLSTNQFVGELVCKRTYVCTCSSFLKAVRWMNRNCNWQGTVCHVLETIPGDNPERARTSSRSRFSPCQKIGSTKTTSQGLDLIIQPGVGPEVLKNFPYEFHFHPEENENPSLFRVTSEAVDIENRVWMRRSREEMVTSIEHWTDILHSDRVSLRSWFAPPRP